MVYQLGNYLLYFFYQLSTVFISKISLRGKKPAKMAKEIKAQKWGNQREYIFALIGGAIGLGMAFLSI